MSREKQTKKVSKERQEYLKFKPFADDLRKAESWCELDGVLNRYQTVKNLSKMGYRKQSDVEKLKLEIEALKIANEKMYAANKAQAREIFEEIEELKWIPFESEHYVVGYDDIAELKKKYTEEKE